MKFLKNLRKDKLKNNRGAVSLLVALTLLTFITILTGTFVTVSILRKSQSDSNIRIKQIYEADVDNIDEVYNSIILHANRTDGEWNRYKGVNNPKLYNTGLIPIYFDENGDVVELTSSSTQDEWDDWYDYDNQKWANAITKDSNGNITGYFVWIPRFAYKIKNNVGNGGNGVTGAIDIVFIDNNNTNNGVTYSETYPTITSSAMDNYVVHPAFTGNINNGGWDNNISGFWVAKYPAGFQANTIIQNNDYSLSSSLLNSSDTVVYSNKNYTQSTTNIYGTVTAGSTKMSYPVFLPLTYAYTAIGSADCYTISRDIQNATSFYGLNNVDSHMEKNSEWGAVAYLAQSSYGRNGTEIQINNFYSSKTLTGVYANGVDTAETSSLAAVYPYNTTVGVGGSSTGNIYGVYDLNGCVWERIACYILNGNEALSESAGSFSASNLSTKWATVYPCDANQDNNASNFSVYGSQKSTTYGFGDSMLETSSSTVGNNSWNRDYNNYPSGTYPFFSRGGRYGNTYGSGLFAFTNANGKPETVSGFRIVIVVD